MKVIPGRYYYSFVFRYPLFQIAPFPSQFYRGFVGLCARAFEVVDDGDGLAGLGPELLAAGADDRVHVVF